MGGIRVAWWNLGNLFDTDDDPISQDFGFTKDQGWSEELYAAKRANLAAALNQLHDGKGPELLGVAEVEGDDVFARLLSDTKNPHLKVARDPAPRSDIRGIDVSIAYDERKLSVVSQHSYVVHLRYPTRDIFEVRFRILDTGEIFVVIASHWPSRRQSRERTEPSRIAVAENIAYLVRNHVRVSAGEYVELRRDNDLAAVQAKWETPVLLLGDFNDEPSDPSVVYHLQASSELDRVIGESNTIDRFEAEVAVYRTRSTWLYNTCWKFLAPENVGSFFVSSTSSGEQFANRYQVIDQMIASRGMLRGPGVRLDPDSVEIFDGDSVATPSGRPRPFDRKTRKGCSNHLPLTAVLNY